MLAAVARVGGFAGRGAGAATSVLVVAGRVVVDEPTGRSVPMGTVDDEGAPVEPGNVVDGSTAAAVGAGASDVDATEVDATRRFVVVTRRFVLVGRFDGFRFVVVDLFFVVVAFFGVTDAATRAVVREAAVAGTDDADIPAISATRATPAMREARNLGISRGYRALMKIV